uniref:Uncharacterized protein n=1 Tax=Picea glauca TaxID=3330 RepID=A0A117NFR3_PICGL|nr:hypothetical protein ABT39_MTgene2490 [Picea glauca]KUM45667.1 hypothetical protein ABT39_MTgene2503 [Picea glauca]KUM45680.1 hypothetical protein ABT39_MTgene2516 [Picea glauca]QHR90856.1 hypothetical protein Q903MT_gene4883 [Picea sitchensis]
MNCCFSSSSYPCFSLSNRPDQLMLGKLDQRMTLMVGCRPCFCFIDRINCIV